MYACHQGDLQHVDGAYHQSLQWLLDNDIESKDEGGTSLDMTFAIDEEELGCITTVLDPSESQTIEYETPVLNPQTGDE